MSEQWSSEDARTMDLAPLIERVHAVNGQIQIEWTPSAYPWRATITIPITITARNRRPRYSSKTFSVTSDTYANMLAYVSATLAHLSTTDRLIHEKLTEK